jgi:hypothetical protein
MKKPTHPRATHATHPADVRLKVWTKKTLKREDWDFSQYFDDEIEDCFSYEFARESQDAIDYIQRGRQSARGCSFDDLLRLNWEDRPAYVGDETPPRLTGFPLFAFCPEWPASPFLSIPRPERKQRLAAYYKDAIEREGIVTDICKAAQFVEGQHEVGGTIQPIERDWQWYVALEIDWRRSNKDMEQSFAEWLKDNRSRNIKPIKAGKVGAGSKLRQMKVDLDSLGAYRLLCAHGTWEKAYNEIFDFTKGKFLSFNASAWSRAKRRAESLIHRPSFHSFFH